VAKYCVIGSNAFSGQDFVDLLLDDPSKEVFGISRSAEKPDFLLRYKSRADLSRFHFHQFDLNDDASAMVRFLDELRPDYIVNFAAQSEVGPSWDHPEHWFQTNAASFAYLVNHLRRVDYLKRYLHVSSPEVYGNCVGTIREDARLNPSTPYAASKAAADMILDVYQRQFNLPVLSVRATNVYGARQQLFKIAMRTIIYIKTGRTIPLHGGGTAVKSYIHVRDVSRGELAILERGTVGEMYHLSPDAGVAVRDFVRMIAERLDVPFEKVIEGAPERPGQDAAYVIDSQKARDTLGWKSEIDLETGIAECVAWVNANWEAILKSSHDYIHKA
jgi:dTDP-glucose 4,6-dehydratase